MKNTNTYGLGEKKSNNNGRWLYFLFVIFLILSSLTLATQEVASYFAYHPSLGQPWFTLFGKIWYAPWKIFSWHKWHDEHEAITNAEFHAQLLFMIPQFIILFFVLLTMRKPQGGTDVHGSAHWASEAEIHDMGLFGVNGIFKGIYVGGYVKKFLNLKTFIRLCKGLPKEQLCYLRHNGPEHILLYAPTRSGKGISIILPTLLSYSESVVVLDIKGENWSKTAGFRKSQGQKVLRFDPADPSGTSACFNPLEEIRLNSIKAIPDVQNVAMMIVDPEGKGLQDYWGKAAFSMVAGVILHCLVKIRHDENRTATLHDLGMMLADESRPINDLFEEMLTTEHEKYMAECFPEAITSGKEIHKFIASSAREMLNKAPNEASGVIGSVIVNLALYRDPVVALNTSKCDFTVYDLMNYDSPVSLYLIVGAADSDRMRPLLRLILNLFIKRICEKMEFSNGQQIKPKRRILFLFDEFTSIGKMEVIDSSIAFAAGYGISYLIVIQDIEQLNKTYGKENGIKGNCHIRIAFAPNTLETAKELSDMTGKTTVVTEKTSLSGSRSGRLKNASVSISETARPLLTPDECMRLPGLQKKGEVAVSGGDMLIFVAGRSPIYGRQILYFQDPTFVSREAMGAPETSDLLHEDSTKKNNENIPADSANDSREENSYANFLREQL
jgi:type IV secretion system protein VirD4